MTHFASFGPVLITAALQNSSRAVNTNIEPKKSELVPKNLKYIQKRYRGNLKDVGYFSSSFKVRNDLINHVTVDFEVQTQTTIVRLPLS